jgi:hypothetical protein
MNSKDQRTRPTRAQRLIAFGFLGAFGLTILTVLLTGLWVRAPHARRDEPPPVEQPGTPNRTAAEQLPAAPAEGRDTAQTEPVDRAPEEREAERDRSADAAPQP